MDYAGGVSSTDEGDHEGAKDSSGYSIPKAKKATQPSSEESKAPAEGSVISLSECPSYVREQIEAMGMGDNVTIKFEGGQYKIESRVPTSKTVKSKCPMSSAGGSSGLSDKFGGMDLEDDDEPSGYTHKSTQTTTTKKGSKTTKKIVTTYKFADGSSQTMTRTITSG